MERNEGEVVRRRIERKEGERYPPSSQSSSSLLLSLLPLILPHHLSILHSSQSATSLPLFSFL
jgi:hypothetical protein